MLKRRTLRIRRSRQSWPSTDFRHYFLGLILSLSFFHKNLLKDTYKKKQIRKKIISLLFSQNLLGTLSGTQLGSSGHIYSSKATIPVQNLQVPPNRHTGTKILYKRIYKKRLQELGGRQRGGWGGRGVRKELVNDVLKENILLLKQFKSLSWHIGSRGHLSGSVEQQQGGCGILFPEHG